jgi:hypothetical protein
MNDRQRVDGFPSVIVNSVDELQVVKNVGTSEKNLLLSLSCFVESIYYSYASKEQIFHLTFFFSCLVFYKTNTKKKEPS